jgi:hypothetical protein
MAAYMILPKMYDAIQGPDMRHKEAIGFSEILALQRQCQPLIGFEKFCEPVRLDGVGAMVEDHLIASIVRLNLIGITRFD